jgi:ankyrin repeat protein
VDKNARNTWSGLLLFLLCFAFGAFICVLIFFGFQRIEIDRRVEPATIGNTPLHLAIFEGLPLERIERIVESNPQDIDRIDPFLGRPIDCAVDKERWEIVNLLLKNGASPNGRMQGVGRHGHSLLLLAAELNYSELANLVLSHGADPAEKLPNGETALEVAKRNGHREIVTMITNLSERDLGGSKVR